MSDLATFDSILSHNKRQKVAVGVRVSSWLLKWNRTHEGFRVQSGPRLCSEVGLCTPIQWASDINYAFSSLSYWPCDTWLLCTTATEDPDSSLPSFAYGWKEYHPLSTVKGTKNKPESLYLLLEFSKTIALPPRYLLFCNPRWIWCVEPARKT